MSVIRAKYQYTEAESIRASREVTNAISFRVRFLPVIGILMLFGAGVSALSDGFKNPPIIIFILGSSLAFMPLFIRYESKKRFKKNPSANDVISWTFSEKFLENHSTGSQASFEWNKLLEVREVKDGFLLYIHRVAYWIPKHAFESSEDVENFRQMVVSSGVKHGMAGKK